MCMQIIEGLLNLGLSDKEARVYIALLQLGRGSAYAVADKAGLKKPTTYVILGELMQKGLVLKVPRMRKQLFIAKSPEEFFALAEERVHSARTVLPELLAMAQGQKQKPRTFFYEGLSGVKSALWYRMKEMTGTEIVGFYASAHAASEGLVNLFYDWNDHIKKSEITIRGIVPNHPSLRHWRETDAEQGRTMKIVPCEKYSATISIDVGDIFVRIISFRDQQGVIIENENVAATVRQIFEMIWGIS